MDNSFDSLKSIVFYIHVLHHFTNSGYHSHQIFNVTHFLNLLYLTKEIVEVELIFSDLFLKFRSFFLIKLLLRPFYQGNNVSHTKNTGSHPVWVENIQGIHFLAGTYKLNR